MGRKGRNEPNSEALLANEAIFPPVFLSTDEIKLVVARAAKRGRVRKIGPRLFSR